MPPHRGRGKLAEIAVRYLKTGSDLYVENRLVRRRQDVDVVADELITLSSKEGDGSTTSRTSSSKTT